MVLLQRLRLNSAKTALERGHSLQAFLCWQRLRNCCSSATSSSYQIRWSSITSSNQSNKSSTDDFPKRNRVVVAMSGGVDSSVAAYLLKKMSKEKSSHQDTLIQNHSGEVDSRNNSVDIVGLHMSNWNALDEDTTNTNISSAKDRNTRRRGQKEPKNDAPKIDSSRQTFNKNSSTPRSSTSTTFCQTSENEYNDANSVAQHLDLPLHRVSFASEYWIQVFEPFIESLSSSCSEDSSDMSNRGHKQMTMPNPDYGCNTYIKFGSMRGYAMDKLNADYVATGHYAQLWHRDYLTSGGLSKYCESSSFHQWMMETSQTLEQQVMKSIAGRPEDDWILNNHLQSCSHAPPPPMLLAGADRNKDQTYFLSGVKGQALRNVIFPLGHLEKRHSATPKLNSNTDKGSPQTVRDIAVKANIPTASKRDSMGICFIGKRNFGQFVSQYLPETPQPGNFVDVDTGEIVGRHEGAVRYTLGEGAKISGAKLRYFVCGKGTAGVGDDANTVFVCNSTHHPALYSDELFVEFDSFNWIGLGDEDSAQGQTGYNNFPRPLVEGQSIKLLARVRHLQPLTSCTVTWQHDENTFGSKGYLRIRFDKAMRAITPGQIVALYAGVDGLICLGGGIIAGPGDSYMDRGMDVTPAMLHPSGSNDLSLRNT